MCLCLFSVVVQVVVDDDETAEQLIEKGSLMKRVTFDQLRSRWCFLSFARTWTRRSGLLSTLKFDESRSRWIVKRSNLPERCVEVGSEHSWAFVGPKRIFFKNKKPVFSRKISFLGHFLTFCFYLIPFLGVNHIHWPSQVVTMIAFFSHLYKCRVYKYTVTL